MKLRGSKYLYLDERDNEEGNGLDKDEGKIEGTRYVFLLFVSLFSPLRKVSNRLLDLDKETKSLNHLV